MHIKGSVEPIASMSTFEMEEKVMEQHKPEYPFAIELDGNVEEKVGQIKNKIPTTDTEQFRREIVNDVSKMVLEQASTDAKPFRDEILSIISDRVAEVRDEFTDIKKEISNLKGDMSNLRTQGISTYEPAIQYGDLNLKQSTIDIIQKNTEYQELNEESEYIDNLIKKYKHIKNKNEEEIVICR